MSSTPSDLEVSDDMVIRITVDGLRSAPRYMYIVRSLEQAQKLFRNAYVVPYVKWYKIPSIYTQLTGKEHNFADYMSYQKIREVRKEVEAYQKSFRETLGTCFTVIPFTPTKEVNAKVTNWKVDKNALAETRNLFNSTGRYREELKDFMKVLLENGNAMSIILRGSLYSNPCEFCSLVYNRITGDCEIFNAKEQHSQTCQPKITFASHIFANDAADVGQQIDYARAEVNEVWEELNAAMEV